MSKIINLLYTHHKGVNQMFATTGIIRENTIIADEHSLEKVDGKKVLITVLEDDKQFDTVSDEKLFAVSDSLINQNIEVYKELAK